MKKFFLPLLAISLTSCTPSVSMETFLSKAQDAEKKEHEYTKGNATAKGDYIIESTLVKVNEEYSYTYKKNNWDIDPGVSSDVRTFTAILVGTMLNSKPSDYASKSDNVKYYASNSGFKIVEESEEKNSSSMSFNSYGLVTDVKIVGSQGTNKVNFTIKYNYSK